MAFDGIVVAGLVHELKQKLTDGRIAKIAQPEADEFHSQNWSVSSVLQSNILMSWATFAKRSSLLKSWGNTATSFSVPKTERSLTVSSMYLHR